MRNLGDELARVRRLVDVGERRVAAQKELVERLRIGGDRTSDAEESILRSMNDALQQMRLRLKA